jgi:hypothetical protein
MTTTDQRLALDPHFLHPRLVLGFLGEERAKLVNQELSQHDPTDEWLHGVAMPTVLTRELAAALTQTGVPELGREHLHGTLAEDQVVGAQQGFYFRRKQRLRRANASQVYFYERLSTDPSIEVHGMFNPEHCVGTSGGLLLSGKRHVYVLGHVTALTSERISLRPILVGRRFYGLASPTTPPDRLPVEVKRRVFPAQVQQFSKIADQKGPSRRELEALRAIPERQVKEWLAEIIGEGRIPKDWGGEQSDLYTSRLAVDGEPVAAAFLLKGPAQFRTMTVKTLGENGDQIERLYQEPADLLVVQHCHEITPQVISMMETYAWDARRPRRYMVIDGYDTLRLLRAYDKL